MGRIIGIMDFLVSSGIVKLVSLVSSWLNFMILDLMMKVLHAV